jgi:D-alanyl-D-alanine carboxypeptidase/D-alanyl-D-alanine-endopeptidase (penicillin-binding protein 4)
VRLAARGSALVVAIIAGISCMSTAGSAAVDDAEVGTLPAAAKKVMQKSEYTNARWIYWVADAKSGKVLLANRPDEMVYTASTAKNFTVGSVYETLGTDTKLTTPVYATTPITDGAVAGDVVLVASGDLAMGGRGALEGKFEHTFNADHVDHVYADIAPNAALVGDPVAGVDDLARQIAAKGVTYVDGDVVIDTRLWDTFSTQDGEVTPIFVNDNLVDVQLTGSQEGQPATLAVTPQSSAYTVANEVQTVGAKGETQLTVEASETDPSTLVVRGTIAAGHTQLTNYRVPDPAAWARTLFIDALARAGVTVAKPARGTNDESTLPSSDALTSMAELASIESPPMSAMGRTNLEMSYNAGSNAFLCLLAVKAGSHNCVDGLATVNELVKRAGLDPHAVFLIDGAGGDPASTTPHQAALWAKWALTRPWGEAFVGGQPVLGKTGSLAANGKGSPAVGKVMAKVGTSVAVGPLDGQLFSKVQSLAGYLTLGNGRQAVFGLYMSGATYPQVYEGLVQAGDDVADVAAAFQQSLSKSS